MGATCGVSFSLVIQPPAVALPRTLSGQRCTFKSKIEERSKLEYRNQPENAMTNALYAKGKEKILSGAINLVSDTIKVILVKNTYPQNLATDEFLSDVSGYRLNTDQILASKSVAAGVFDAGDATWSAVTAGDTSEGVVIYKDTGVAGTSPLLAYIDTITGFPLATNGGDITAAWDNGAYKIFSL